MEHLDKIIMGWVAIQSLGIGGLIWRSINMFFDVKELKKNVLELEQADKTLQADIDNKFEKKFEKLEFDINKKFQELETSIDKKFEKLEERETKFECRFEEMSKTQQDMRESQIKQVLSLDHIKESLFMLTNQLLEKKTDTINIQSNQ